MNMFTNTTAVFNRERGYQYMGVSWLSVQGCIVVISTGCIMVICTGV